MTPQTRIQTDETALMLYGHLRLQDRLGNIATLICMSEKNPQTQYSSRIRFLQLKSQLHRPIFNGSVRQCFCASL